MLKSPILMAEVAVVEAAAAVAAATELNATVPSVLGDRTDNVLTDKRPELELFQSLQAAPNNALLRLKPSAVQLAVVVAVAMELLTATVPLVRGVHSLLASTEPKQDIAT
jgi:hypothetical protein